MRPDVVPPRASAPGAPSPRIEAERAELLALKALVADVRFTLALWRLARKYRPDQPRVPAGNPDGGQWTGEGGSVGGEGISSLPRMKDRPTLLPTCERNGSWAGMQLKSTSARAGNFCWRGSGVKY
jgi:hypothetical protein